MSGTEKITAPEIPVKHPNDVINNYSVVFGLDPGETIVSISPVTVAPTGTLSDLAITNVVINSQVVTDYVTGQVSPIGTAATMTIALGQDKIIYFIDITIVTSKSRTIVGQARLKISSGSL